MESKNTKPPQAEASSSEGPDKAAIELSREIFHLMTHAVTAMKLYPSHHETVREFFDGLYAKLRAYFETQPELDVEVQEYAFVVGGEPVYVEEHLAKSLPYLFHKDGMRKFALLREIDKTELRDFLEVIRKTSLLPLDESDIVIALWEKDLPDIRVFAPDDYLLAKIDVFTRQPFELFVDRHQLFTGQIDLSAEDLKDIESKSLSLGLMEQEEETDYAGLVTSTEDADQGRIESLLADARKIPPEKEFHDMIFELLSLEDRAAEVASILEFLERHHRELIREDKFIHAVQFFKQLHELRDLFSSAQPGKAAELKRFLTAFPDGRTDELVREAIERKSFDSLPSFFEYLRFMRAKSIPIAVELLAEDQEPETRRLAIAYLEEVGREDIEVLAGQLQDGKPAISKEIIALLGHSRDKKALTYLAQLNTYANKEIKLAAIEILALSPEPLAQRILFTFFQDEDEEIVAAAADALRWPGEKTLLERITRMISARPFRGRGTRAKIAIMSFLARTGTPEAQRELRKVMERSGFFARARRQHTRLCAVEALAASGTPGARDVLERGQKSSNKEVSEACRRALDRSLSKARS
jgi:tRNA A37 threonylcarbamoyladenosine biosynthesis protein TsaE